MGYGDSARENAGTVDDSGQLKCLFRKGKHYLFCFIFRAASIYSKYIMKRK